MPCAEGGRQILPKLASSYVHGTSNEPLLGQTIGVTLDRTAARFPDNEALVVCHQGYAGPTPS
jgi:hypothetical protein